MGTTARIPVSRETWTAKISHWPAFQHWHADCSSPKLKRWEYRHYDGHRIVTDLWREATARCGKCTECYTHRKQCMFMKSKSEWATVTKPPWFMTPTADFLGDAFQLDFRDRFDTQIMLPRGRIPFHSSGEWELFKWHLQSFWKRLERQQAPQHRKVRYEGVLEAHPGDGGNHGKPHGHFLAYDAPEGQTPLYREEILLAWYSNTRRAPRFDPAGPETRGRFNKRLERWLMDQHQRWLHASTKEERATYAHRIGQLRRIKRAKTNGAIGYLRKYLGKDVTALHRRSIYLGRGLRYVQWLRRTRKLWRDAGYTGDLGWLSKPPTHAPTTHLGPHRGPHLDMAPSGRPPQSAGQVPPGPYRHAEPSRDGEHPEPPNYGDADGPEAESFARQARATARSLSQGTLDPVTCRLFEASPVRCAHPEASPYPSTGPPRAEWITSDTTDAHAFLSSLYPRMPIPGTE